MSISISRYVNVNSQVGGAPAALTRDLIGRCFTNYSALAPNSFLQFSNAADVGLFFGTNTEEYYRALFYFSWISKNLEQPDAIQFARWVPEVTTVQTGSTTDAMDTITALQSTAGLLVGTPVTGAGIPANTTVASITGGTSITISNNATATATGVSLTFTSPGVSPQIYSVPGQTQSLAAWNAITSGGFGLTIGGVSNTFSGLDFAAAGSLAAVAGIIQTAINGASGQQWTDATVTYNPATQGFDFVGGLAANVSISVQRGLSPSQDITGLNLLGWYPGNGFTNNIFSITNYNSNALWVPGHLVQDVATMLTASVAQSNNFGSFLFLNNLNISLANITEAATWNYGENVSFLYTIPVTASNISSYVAALSTIGGCSLTFISTPLTANATLTSGSATITGLVDATSTYLVGQYVTGFGIPYGTVIQSITNDTTIVLSSLATATGTESLTFWQSQYPEMCPMMIEAATNYSNANSVQNYMFQQFPGLNPTVFDDSTANAYDAESLNYYGQTQNAGTPIDFYQRGLMQGPATSPLDQNTYVNELWLKDTITVAFMNLLLSLNQLPANQQGQALSLLTLQGVINQALSNGVISVGKNLTTAQIQYINNVTQSNTAWYQVQNSGYWVDAQITIIPESSPPQYQVSYTLIYSKDDTIRLVSGQDILI